jgi:hypothetical protein
MGKDTSRRNKRTSESTEGQQTAFQTPPPVVTTRLTIVNEGATWSWTLEHYGKTYEAGVPPATGPARFNELSSALASAEANYAAARWMKIDQRRLENAKRSMKEATPSPGD